MRTASYFPIAFLKQTFSIALVVVASAGSSGCSQNARAMPLPVQGAPVLATMAQGQPQAAPPVPATFSVADLAERVKPVVVNITTTHNVHVQGFDGMDPFEFFFGHPRGGGPFRSPDRTLKTTALGSGFIIDPEGFVVTNEHVVHEADEVRVRLADDREFVAEVVGRDPKLDLALMKLKGAQALPAAALGSSDQLRVGEHVLAVGNPFGLGHTVTLGIVSAKARTIGAGPYDDFIQTDASINPGNSGGPLFNWKGEVIGINTAIRAGANGIGFAIPIDELKDVLPQLREKGRVQRGKLGLAFQPMTQDLSKALGLDTPRGALVAQVEPGSAAARAGIKPGDVIVAVNGAPIQRAEELPRHVGRNAPGATVKLSLLRERQPKEVSATLDALADEEEGPAHKSHGRAEAGRSSNRLGLQVSEASGGGVRIDGIQAESRVRELQEGDVIVEINGARVRNVDDLQAALTKLKSGTTAIVKVRRGELERYAAVVVP